MERSAADSWYRVRPVGDDVSLIDEHHIREFYRCNIWHVRGRDRDLLVDSGMGVVSLREEVPLVSARPLLAVASHTHFDHIGGHWEFPERLVHVAEAGILATPTRTTTVAEPYVSEAIFDKAPPLPFAVTTYCPRAAPATRLLEDGDVVDLGDRRFEVVHTPGHSPGGIALLEGVTGILFSGDIVYDGPLIEDTYHADLAAYIASMRRLLTLPVRVVHGGHFASFSGTRLRSMIEAWLRDKDA